jgi:glutathione S-transferase
MLQLYGSEKTRAFRVLWLLEELNLPYKHMALNFAAGEHKSPDYLKLNPSGKVPVLVDGSLVIHESSAILLHLLDSYGEGSSLEISRDKRTELYQWLFYGSSELEQGLWTAARHSFVYPPEKRIEAAVASGRAEFTSQLPYLSKMLGDKLFLLGDQFTIADILIAHILLWGSQQQKLDLVFDNINQYLKRCVSRPNYSKLVDRFKSESKKP